jgi:hypothetical protein
VACARPIRFYASQCEGAFAVTVPLHSSIALQGCTSDSRCALLQESRSPINSAGVNFPTLCIEHDGTSPRMFRPKLPAKKKPCVCPHAGGVKVMIWCSLVVKYANGPLCLRGSSSGMGRQTHLFSDFMGLLQKIIFLSGPKMNQFGRMREPAGPSQSSNPLQHLRGCQKARL